MDCTNLRDDMGSANDSSDASYTCKMDDTECNDTSDVDDDVRGAIDIRGVDCKSNIDVGIMNTDGT